MAISNYLNTDYDRIFDNTTNYILATSNVLKTDYKVSTITCNADLGINLNLDILYENFQINDKFIWIYYPKIDYQALYYYSAPKSFKEGPKSLDEIDPEIKKTYEKLGIPLNEQKRF